MERDAFYTKGMTTLLAPRSQGLKFAMLAAVLILGTIWLLDPGKQWPQTMTKAHGRKVPLEAHIMSRCPDARDCLRELVVPTMERAASKVDFTLSFIGTPTQLDGVQCKHGPAECIGNTFELCAAHLYPDPKLYLGFVMCLENDYEKIPDQELIENCAQGHGLDFRKIVSCVSDESRLGMGMLRASVTRSMDANVSISCTVRLNDNVRCIRDDNQWKDCEDGSTVESLVNDIEELWRKQNRPLEKFKFRRWSSWHG